ncbi:VirB8/TrbF family protein [Candidatus Bandiella numerosa]|uniref:VirB8/TrbF family protein n=1 Tax=Candidatus Bandiella numerosa TaxID=2570586 RepID=UPI001F021588|nr:VirB8/TrbF family protein [Candidatus Bandiella numerosa]
MKNWSDDRYQSTVIQRNLLLLLLLLLIVCFILIIISLTTIRYLKNTQSIDPFVIEIEKKSGVSTVVEPLSIKTYSADGHC